MFYSVADERSCRSVHQLPQMVNPAVGTLHHIGLEVRCTGLQINELELYIMLSLVVVADFRATRCDVDVT